MIYVLLGVGRGLFLDDLIGSYGPNWVRWIFCVIGKIAEGLAVLDPLRLFREGFVWPIGEGIPIRFSEEGIPLGAEILEGLGIDEFLEFGFELLFWGFFVTFGELYGFVCRPPLQWESDSVV